MRLLENALVPIFIGHDGHITLAVNRQEPYSTYSGLSSAMQKVMSVKNNIVEASTNYM